MSDNLTETPRLQQVLETAAEIARSYGHTHLGVEHVQLAILADRGAIPTQVLRRMGFEPDTIAAEITRIVEAESYRNPQRRARALDGTVTEY